MTFSHKLATDSVTIGGKVTKGGKVTTQQLVWYLSAEARATGEPRTTNSVLDMRFVTDVTKYQVRVPSYFIGKVSIAIKRVH